MSEQESVEWHKGFQMGLYSGKKVEQEHIIKLLEELYAESKSGVPSVARDWYSEGIWGAIALIKGENK